MALKKILAEPDAGSTTARWIGSGRVVRDNKGRVIKEYEPYWSTNEAYEDEDEVRAQGASPIHHYDPLGRLVRTEHADGTESRVEVGVWLDRKHDPNDAVRGTSWLAARSASSDPRERRAASMALLHEQTPTVEHKDALGRTFLVVQDNGPAGKLSTRTRLDLEGHPLEVRDPLGRLAMKTVFDILGRPLRVETLDGGAREIVLDASGTALRQHRVGPLGPETLEIELDLLRRPVRVWSLRAGVRRLAERVVWGEVAANAASRNLRGRVHAQYDAAGLLLTEAYDLHGEIATSSRRFAVTFTADPDWAAIQGDMSAEQAAIIAEPLLESERHHASFSYDAQGRAVASAWSTSSSSLASAGGVQTFERNIRGLLERVTLDKQGVKRAVVDSIRHDARGERLSIRGGNGVLTAYARDPKSQRLVRQTSTRAADGSKLTDAHYFYDAAGNVVQIDDDGDTTELFGRDLPAFEKKYAYDAVNRLVEATGVEHPGQGGQPISDDVARTPHTNDLQALRAYTERFTYDDAGNLLEMKHEAAGAGWTRGYAYQVGTNRLAWTSVPGDPSTTPSNPAARYAHDAWGNMTKMFDRVLSWDAFDRLREVDLGGGGKAYYQYDATGQRVRKVVERNGGIREERRYLGSHEVARRYVAGTLDTASETEHVMDDQRCVALVERVTVRNGGPAALPALVRHQLDDHLGSTTLELDESGGVLTYEAYHPYGSTAFRTARKGLEVADRRYRYNAKERDEETGLHYYGARYYAAWLGRWTACDPEGLVDGPTPYGYVGGAPACCTDPSGRQRTRTSGDSKYVDGTAVSIGRVQRRFPVLAPPPPATAILADDSHAAQAKLFRTYVTKTLPTLNQWDNRDVGVVLGTLEKGLMRPSGGPRQKYSMIHTLGHYGYPMDLRDRHRGGKNVDLLSDSSLDRLAKLLTNEATLVFHGCSVASYDDWYIKNKLIPELRKRGVNLTVLAHTGGSGPGQLWDFQVYSWNGKEVERKPMTNASAVFGARWLADYFGLHPSLDVGKLLKAHSLAKPGDQAWLPPDVEAAAKAEQARRAGGAASPTAPSFPPAPRFYDGARVP